MTTFKKDKTEILLGEMARRQVLSYGTGAPSGIDSPMIGDYYIDVSDGGRRYEYRMTGGQASWQVVGERGSIPLFDNKARYLPGSMVYTASGDVYLCMSAADPSPSPSAPAWNRVNSEEEEPIISSGTLGNEWMPLATAPAWGRKVSLKCFLPPDGVYKSIFTLSEAEEVPDENDITFNGIRVDVRCVAVAEGVRLDGRLRPPAASCSFTVIA